MLQCRMVGVESRGICIQPYLVPTISFILFALIGVIEESFVNIRRNKIVEAETRVATFEFLDFVDEFLLTFPLKLCYSRIDFRSRKTYIVFLGCQKPVFRIPHFAFLA
jgi:hypothetical protein